jgi:GTPase SAR1 family protein
LRHCFCAKGAGYLNMSAGPVLTVVGTTSSGKSTLINSLLGSWILPSGVQETTAVATRVSLRTTVKAWSMAQGAESARFRHAHELRVALGARMKAGAVRDIISIVGPNPSKWIERTPRLAWSFASLWFEDLPGFLHRQDRSRLQLYERRLRRASVVLLLLDVRETDEGKSRLVAETVSSALTSTSVPVVCALNHIDELQRDEQPEAARRGAVRKWEGTLRKVLGYSPPLVCTTATAGLAAVRLVQDTEPQDRDSDALALAVRLAAGGVLAEAGLPRGSLSTWGRLTRIQLGRRLFAASGVSALEAEVAKALKAACRWPKLDRDG